MKKRIPIIVVLSVAVAIGATVWLVVRWNAAGQSRIIVTTTGPLDIHLWGIRPDAGDTIYDPNGKKIRQTLGITRWDNPHWRDKSQRFDFIFELPDANEPPLFRTFPRVEVSGEDTTLGGGFGSQILDYKGKKLLWLRTTFDRTFRRSILGGLWITEPTVDAVDITLEYYHGPPGKAIFTLNGPFKRSSEMTSEDGVYRVAFKHKADAVYRQYGQFELTTSEYFDGRAPVVAYDEAGRRHLASTGNRTSSREGSRIAYNVPGALLERLTKIAFGETPHQITFKGIKLDVSQDGGRNHASYLDEMAERLGLNMTGKELADYNFKSADEALEVIDVVRGIHIVWAAEAILAGGAGTGRPGPPTLDDEQTQKLKDTLARWLQALDPEFRARAIRLGLIYSWPEFVEPALELLDDPAIYDDRETREPLTQAAYALQTYKAKLSDQAIARIAQILLRRDERDILTYLKQCFWSPKSQARIDALWELAEDDRPWLWWDAVDRLAQWGQFDGKQDSLPDKLKLRLVLLRGTAGFSDPQQIAARAYGLLPELLRPELRLLDASTFYRVLERIAEKLDRERATEAVVNFLRCVEDYDYSGQAVADKIVKYINLWHGLNIGELGADIDRQTSELQKYDWPAITAEAIKWYESKQDASDSNSGSP